MNRKQRIIISVTGIFIVLLILVGLTYGYFLTKINGNTNIKSISVTTANLELAYSDNSAEILGKDLKLIPSDTEIGTKTFTVTNNGDDTSYVVVIENVSITKDGTTTTFESNDFRYTLGCTKKDGTSCDGVSTQSVFPINDGILVGNSISKDDVHTYTFKMWYIDTGIDQSNDMGKTIQARLNIADIRSVANSYSNSKNSLAYNIIENAKNKTNGAEFSLTPKTKVAEEINAIDEKILTLAIDDYGISYYYRGNVIDNYVNFAGMCWRIVRIQGDGSIKLILEDQDSTCATSDGNWDIPTTTGGTTKTGNFGYTIYEINTLTASDGTANSKELMLMNYLNGKDFNNQSMITSFENFQTGPLANYLDKLKPGDWCMNDKTYTVVDGIPTLLLNSQAILDNQVKTSTRYLYYDSYVRLIIKRESTLKCNGTVMTKFNDNKSMYVGTLTADEIIHAGGKVDISNPDYYLINAYQKNNSSYFWSLSPSWFYVNSDRIFSVKSSGEFDLDIVEDSNSFRPTIILKSGIQITGGDGTISNPYKVN